MASQRGNHRVKPTAIRSVTNLYGEATLDAMATADRVEWFRIDPQTRGVGDGIEGYRVVAVGPVLRPPETRGLIDILMSDTTYRWGAASGCKPTPGVAARLRAGTSKVFVILCFECDELQVVRREAGGHEAADVRHNFLPGRPALVRLAKEAFPKDRAIQAMSDAARVLVRRPPPKVRGRGRP
jgi:hypothetical protein